MTEKKTRKRVAKPKIVKEIVEHVTVSNISNQTQDADFLLDSQEVIVERQPSIPEEAQEVVEKKFIGFHPVTGAKVYI
jgi:hypothetical protein